MPSGPDRWAPLQEVLGARLPEPAEGAGVVGGGVERDEEVVGADESGGGREIRSVGKVAVIVEACPAKPVEDVLRRASCAPCDGGVVVGGC